MTYQILLVDSQFSFETSVTTLHSFRDAKIVMASMAKLMKQLDSLLEISYQIVPHYRLKIVDENGKEKKLVSECQHKFVKMKREDVDPNLITWIDIINVQNSTVQVCYDCGWAELVEV